jgi:hypothetical protein
MVKDLQVDSFRLLVFVYIRAVKGPVQRKDLVSRQPEVMSLALTRSDITEGDWKYVLRMRNRKLRNIRPSGAF